QAALDAGDAAPDLALPIDRRAFDSDLRQYQAGQTAGQNPPRNSRYYGPERSLRVMAYGTSLPTLPDSTISPLHVMGRDLSDWDEAGWQPPDDGFVAVDVAQGRLAFAAKQAPARVVVSYNYGFAADVGAGPFDRRDSLAVPRPETWTPAPKADGTPVT